MNGGCFGRLFCSSKHHGCIYSRDESVSFLDMRPEFSCLEFNLPNWHQAMIFEETKSFY